MRRPVGNPEIKMTLSVLFEVACYTEHGAGGGTRTPTGLPPTDFRTSYGFRRPCYAPLALRRVRGLDYPFTLPRPRIASGASRGLGAARLVSTPSRFRAWLGIAVERFPRVWAVLRPRFPAAHSMLQVRCVCHSATPAWRAKLYPWLPESPRRHSPQIRGEFAPTLPHVRADSGPT